VTFGVVILAGGRATRFPGKLSADVDGVPMVVRVVHNLRAASHDVVCATSAEAAGALAALLDVPVVVDAEPARGPLGGLVAACNALHSETMFVAAGDAPYLDADFATSLAAGWRAGDEALVPTHVADDGELRNEPLAAVYDRVALLREGKAVLLSGRGSMQLVLARLRTRYVAVDEPPERFTNVNTPADYAAFRERIARERATPAPKHTP